MGGVSVEKWGVKCIGLSMWLDTCVSEWVWVVQLCSRVVYLCSRVVVLHGCRWIMICFPLGLLVLMVVGCVLSCLMVTGIWVHGSLPVV